MRVLVCGGRGYKDREAVYKVLDELYPKMSALMCGGAAGADTLAWDWGSQRRFYCERYMAQWDRYGRSAGPIRNKVMLEEGKPDLVIAFPGGRGTQNMISQALQAGIEVRVIE